MPQLDIIPFASQYIWFIVSFFLSYFLFLKYLLPMLSQWIKIEFKFVVFHIIWLNAYQQNTIKKDLNSSKLVAFAASLISSVELLIERTDILVQELVDIIHISEYEKGLVYLGKQCFLSVK